VESHIQGQIFGDLHSVACEISVCIKQNNKTHLTMTGTIFISGANGSLATHTVSHLVAEPPLYFIPDSSRCI
jgi:hypothetical protein